MRRLLCATSLTAMLFVLAAAPSWAGGGCHGRQTESTGDTVEMKEMCFTPTVLHIEPGTEVEFVNRDPMAHIVVGVGWGAWTELGKGDATTHRFDEAGAYPYTCNLHAGMNGVVLVGDGGDTLATEPISATSKESASIGPLWFGLGLMAIVAAVFAGRLTARHD